MTLGPPWVKWDKMTSSLKFLYVTQGLKECLTTSWEQHEKWIKGEACVGESTPAPRHDPSFSSTRRWGGRFGRVDETEG